MQERHDPGEPAVVAAQVDRGPGHLDVADVGHRLEDLLERRSVAPAVAFLILLPLLSSSRKRSKIRILASTPIPSVSTSAATPGSVSVAPRLASTPRTIQLLTEY